MKLKSILAVILFCVQPLSTPWAIEIVRPAQDTVVHPGDTVTIEVVPSPGERVGIVFFEGLSGIEDDTPPYIHRYTVGPQDIGALKIDIFAIKPDSDGPFASDEEMFSSDIELRLISTLPPTTVVNGIRVRDDQRSLFMRVESKRLIDVYGQFSDGVERLVTSGMGTTYSSSDEKVVTVNADGLVKATGVGMARITVKNGEHELTIKAKVDPPSKKKE